MEREITPDSEYENIIQNTKSRFPEIEFNANNFDIPYVAIGDFNAFLINQFQNNNKEILQKAFGYIEELHNSKSEKVREFATIGILEGIQSIMEGGNLSTNEIEKFLGTETKKWWSQLNKFWDKEIKSVGETISE